jgi:hypothetical protein
MKKLSLALVSGLCLFGLLFTSISLAAEAPPGSTRLTSDPHTALPAVVTPTNQLPHPMVEALAAHFGVPAEEIAALHDAGLGFGVIARAYSLAEHFEDVSPQALLAEFQAGLGWGQIARQYGLNPGRGRDGAPGQVISDQAQEPVADTGPENQAESNDASHPGQGHGRANAPGQNKDKANRGQGNPGQDQESGE